MSLAVKTAMGIVKSINPQLAQKAEAELKKYSQNSEGLQQLVQSMGGKVFLDSAYNFACSNPKVSGMLNKFGVDPATLKSQVEQALNERSSLPVKQNNKSSEAMSGYLDRLNNLK